MRKETDLILGFMLDEVEGLFGDVVWYDMIWYDTLKGYLSFDLYCWRGNMEGPIYRERMSDIYEDEGDFTI